MVDDEQQRQFEESAGQWYRWQHVAREFVIAANYLIDWYDPPREDGPKDMMFTIGGCAPMMVLYAVAVENLLKAVLVAQGSLPVAAGTLARGFAHHNLVQHAEKAGLALAAEERDLLEHLRDMMESGKYPVAMGPGKNPGAWRFDYPRDVDRVWSMLERLEDALRKTGKPCLPTTDLRRRYRPPGYDVTEVM